MTMIAKRLATLLTAVAVTASAPAFAQASAPVPARENSLSGSSQFGSDTAAYVVAAIILGGLVYGFIEFLDDDDGGDDVPVSP
jgi:hypothetical protein